MARKSLKGRGPSPPPRCDSLPPVGLKQLEARNTHVAHLQLSFPSDVAGVYDPLVVEIDQRKRTRAPRVRPFAVGAAGLLLSSSLLDPTPRFDTLLSCWFY